MYILLHTIHGLSSYHTPPSPANAFNSPLSFLNVTDFYNGVNDIGEYEDKFAHILKEKGRQDMAQYVRNGRLQHRFAFCCAYDLEDWGGFRFLGLFQGLREATGVDDGLDWDRWKSVARLRYKDDPRLQLLLQREDGLEQ